MKKAFSILSISTLIFIIGINIAYYNTASLMKEKVSLISFSSESVEVYEHDIRYEDIKKASERFKKLFPDENITI